jgi:Rrf2 family protein
MISVTAQHAVRALVELAALPEGDSMGGRDLARLARIPSSYLAKILGTLGSAGLVDAARGTGGGYRLSRSPDAVHLADVVGLFDPARSASDCLLDGTHPCSEATACAAHDDWRRVKEAYVRFLETTTLAKLAERHERVRSSQDASAHPRPR